MKLLSKKFKKSNNSKAVFLLRLFNVLNDKEKRFSEYIYWSADGNSFIIPDKDKFTENVLSKISKSNDYDSFVRIVNMYDFKKKKTGKKGLIEYEHEEFNQNKSEEEIKLKKKKKKEIKTEIEEESIHTNNMLGKKIEEDNRAEDKNFMEKIEELDEESKLKEFKNILKKGHLSNTSNKQILNCLLDKTKALIESKKSIEENLYDVILTNNELMKKIQSLKESQDQIIKKKNQIIAVTWLSLIIIKNERKKQLQKHIFNEIKKYKKDENKIIKNEDIKNLKSNNIDSENNKIIFNDDNHDFFNNNPFYNIDNDKENNNELLNSGSYSINKNIEDGSIFFSNRIKINNNNIFKNNSININNGNSLLHYA